MDAAAHIFLDLFAHHPLPLFAHTMFCAISAEVPQEPVISAKTGHLYEKRVIEKHLRAEGKCPITGADMSEDDLITVQSAFFCLSSRVSMCVF